MSTPTLNPVAYGELLARVQPHPIKDDREYDRLVAEVGRLMGRGREEPLSGGNLTPRNVVDPD